MEQNTYPNSLKKALDNLGDIKELKQNELAHLPSIRNRWLCQSMGCQHSSIDECLMNAIESIIISRLKNFRKADKIWQGCLLLWIYYIYPVMAGKKKISLTVEYPQHSFASSSEKKELQQLLVAGVNTLEADLFAKEQLKSLWEDWPPGQATRYNKTDSAQAWLLDQLLTPPEHAAKAIAGILEERFSDFDLIGLTEIVSLKDFFIVPKLRLLETRELISLEMLAQTFENKYYIWGSVAGGKSVLSRYITWLLAILKSG